LVSVRRTRIVRVGLAEPRGREARGSAGAGRPGRRSRAPARAVISAPVVGTFAADEGSRQLALSRATSETSRGCRPARRRRRSVAQSSSTPRLNSCTRAVLGPRARGNIANTPPLAEDSGCPHREPCDGLGASRSIMHRADGRRAPRRREPQLGERVAGEVAHGPDYVVHAEQRRVRGSSRGSADDQHGAHPPGPRSAAARPGKPNSKLRVDERPRNRLRRTQSGFTICDSASAGPVPSGPVVEPSLRTHDGDHEPPRDQLAPRSVRSGRSRSRRSCAARGAFRARAVEAIAHKAISSSTSGLADLPPLGEVKLRMHGGGRASLGLGVEEETSNARGREHDARPMSRGHSIGATTGPPRLATCCGGTTIFFFLRTGGQRRDGRDAATRPRTALQ
jgi:hypothetical protein